MPYLLLALLICLPPITQAEIYKWVDEKGIHFADEAPAGVDAETVIVEPPKSNTPAGSQSSKPAARPMDAPPEHENNNSKSIQRYTNLEITHPDHDQTLRANGGNVSVSCSLTPALQSDAGHQLRFLLNGQPFAISSSCDTTLEGVDRGSHEISAEVIDQEGVILLRSDTTHFTLQRNSRRH